MPQPNPTLVPTVEIAPAVGWTDGATPTPAADMKVTAFAEDLDHPRWLYVLPNGDVLVTGGRPTGPMQVVLSGFVDTDGNARGRPVGVSLDGRGGLLVADDVGNSVWRVTPARELPGRAPTSASISEPR